MGQNKHRPGHHFASERPDFGVATVVPAPGKVEAWQKVWKLQSLQRMWTPADLAHAGNLRFSAKLQLLGPDNPFPLSLSLSPLPFFFFCSVLLCLLPQLPHPLGKSGSRQGSFSLDRGKFATMASLPLQGQPGMEKNTLPDLPGLPDIHSAPLPSCLSWVQRPTLSAWPLQGIRVPSRIAPCHPQSLRL